MEKLKLIFTLLLFLFLVGCTDEPTPPADFWGGVGFAYQADSGGKHRHNGPAATTTVGFEKELGGGLGIGGEMAGITH